MAKADALRAARGRAAADRRGAAAARAPSRVFPGAALDDARPGRTRRARQPGVPELPVAADPGRSQRHQVSLGARANSGLEIACRYQVNRAAEDGLQVGLHPA